MGVWSKEIFARNLRYYMERNKLNQKELAASIGVSPPTLHDWLSGKKYPRIDKVERLANYFGILKSDLIEEKMTVEKEKDNEVMADLIVRMRTDNAFLSVVKELDKLDHTKLQLVQEMLKAFSK